jgi:hypothetical protein
MAMKKSKRYFAPVSVFVLGWFLLIGTTLADPFIDYFNPALLSTSNPRYSLNVDGNSDSSYPRTYRGTIFFERKLTSSTNEILYECNGFDNMEIILNADGTLQTEFAFTYFESASTSGENLGFEDSCGLREPGEYWFNCCWIQESDPGMPSNYPIAVNGTHTNGTFTIPWLAFWKNVTGTYDDETITSSGSVDNQFGLLTYSFTLYRVRSKITMNARSESSDLVISGNNFQYGLLKRYGFSITITNPGGIFDNETDNYIDWSKFRVYVNDVDTTEHFLKVGLEFMTWDRSSTDDITLYFTSDPRKLMEEHNLFNILFNGTHKIWLNICNKAGICTYSEYRIFFGPFPFFPKPTTIAQLCRNIPPYWNAFVIAAFYEGNTGYRTNTDRFFILQVADKLYSFECKCDDGCFCFLPGRQYPDSDANSQPPTPEISPWLGNELSLGTGDLLSYPTIVFYPTDWLYGYMRFWFVILDKDYGSLSYDFLDFDFCPR